jgi:DNA-binding NarL/FixJ family response regulator
LKVFIADDSELMRERLVAMLAELPGIEIVGQARDGLEAIDLIPKLQPDVVILDIRMPGRNGIDVLNEIKGHDPAPLVIMFTNYPYPQYRDKCLKAGADFFFDKATDFEKLMQVLTTLAQETHKT